MTDLVKSKNSRNGTADLLKGLAVLFMIQVHIMEQFASPDTFGSTIGKVSMFLGGPPCAPIFMAVMGYFLASSTKSLAYYMKRGIVLFLGGILLNTGRSANLLLQIHAGKVHLDPLFYVMGADILTLAGLSLLIIGILRLILKQRSMYYFLIAAAIAAFTPLLNKAGNLGFIPSHILAFLWGTEAWSYFPLFPWLAYILAGYGFSLLMRESVWVRNIDISKHYLYFIPLWAGTVVTLAYAAGITHTLEGAGGYYHHGLLFFSWIILFMVSYLSIIQLVETFYGGNSIARAIKWVGKEVTALYIIQWLIIGNLAAVLYRTQDMLQLSGWLVVVVIATILSGTVYVQLKNKLKSR